MLDMIRNHPEPFDVVVDWYGKQKFLSEVRDPEAWKAEQLERLTAEAAQKAQERLAQTQPGTAAAPPPTVGGIPSAGASGVPGPHVSELRKLGFS